MFIDRFSYQVTRQISIICLIIFSATNLFCQVDSRDQDPRELLGIANEIQFYYPDSAARIYQEAYQIFLDRKDTLGAIDCLISWSEHSEQNAKFDIALNGYDEALLLSDGIQYQRQRAEVYSGLGWMYGIFARVETSERYFKESISIIKSQDSLGNDDYQAIVDNFFALSTICRTGFRIEQAHMYLDSCVYYNQLTNSIENNKAFIESELAHVLFLEKKYEEALSLLDKTIPHFQATRPSYLVIINMLLGDIYLDMNNRAQSLKYYQDALTLSDKHKSHQNVKPRIHEQEALIYSMLGDHQKAYEHLMTAKQLNEDIFGSRSESNQRILELTDNYREEQEKKDKELRKQKLAELEAREKANNLEKIILWLALGSILVIFIISVRWIRNRQKIRQLVMEKDQKHVMEIMEVKNKELTASALQIIEKEEMLAELKVKLEEIKVTPDQNKIRQLANSIHLNQKKNWNDFNLRFVSVNSSFYDTLGKKFPNLSQGDQKICALIKLNFSSKEMSRLLGISVESVHTTRYRLRRKLNLERKDNLEDFIAAI